MTAAAPRGPRVARVALAVAALAAAAACARRGEEPPRTPVVLAVAALPHAALVHLALAEGDLAAEGLDVTVRTFPYGQAALSQLLDGAADLATVADTPVALATLRGKRVAVLATIATSTRGNLLLVRRGDGIASVRDLARRRVGLARGTSSEFFLDGALMRAEISPRDVTLVDLKPAELEEALRSRAVDAVATFPPYATALTRALAPDVAVVEDALSFETFDLVATPALAARGDVSRRVLRALLRAEARARSAPEAARRAVAARLGIPPAELAPDWARFRFEVGLEQSLLVLLEQEARWAIRAGLVTARPTPDFRAALAPAPLRDVRPGAVRLIW